MRVQRLPITRQAQTSTGSSGLSSPLVHASRHRSRSLRSIDHEQALDVRARRRTRRRLSDPEREQHESPTAASTRTPRMMPPTTPPTTETKVRAARQMAYTVDPSAHPLLPRPDMSGRGVSGARHGYGSVTRLRPEWNKPCSERGDRAWPFVPFPHSVSSCGKRRRQVARILTATIARRATSHVRSSSRNAVGLAASARP